MCTPLSRVCPHRGAELLFVMPADPASLAVSAVPLLREVVAIRVGARQRTTTVPSMEEEEEKEEVCHWGQGRTAGWKRRHGPAEVDASAATNGSLGRAACQAERA